MKRLLTNVAFGCAILLILILAVVFRYYIDKQTNLNMDGTEHCVTNKLGKMVM